MSSQGFFFLKHLDVTSCRQYRIWQAVLDAVNCLDQLPGNKKVYFFFQIDILE